MATEAQKETARTYRDAAGEHLAAAAALYRLRQYVLANYAAGLATECILRAYRTMLDPEFDARHDLRVLFGLAKFDGIVPPGREREVGAALTTVAQLWSNDHRFLSEVAMRKRIARRKQFTGIRGDALKELTRQLINASSSLVALGVMQWKSSFES